MRIRRIGASRPSRGGFWRGNCPAMDDPRCLWCGRAFVARRGGSPQRFCRARCRTAFWSALRRWGERAVAAGILTIGDIRTGDPAPCTLLLKAIPPKLVGRPSKRPSVPVAPPERLVTQQEEFECLLARTVAARRR